MSAGAVIGPKELSFIGMGDGPEAATGLSPGTDLNLERMERQMVELALSRSGQNVTQAARLLGVSRDTLRYRLERLGLRAQGAPD